MDHQPPRPDQPYAWDDERLSAYLDGELSAPEQAQLEARLVVDPELRQLVDELRAVRQQLEILPEYRLQATFAEQVLRRAEQEMLLTPVTRETTSVSIAAATTAMPAVPATLVEAAATPVPRQSLARRWQRGVIWTAVAAAAVLLLIVTNRPLDPDQVHVAKNDPDTKVTVEHGATKPGEVPTNAAKNGPAAAKFSATQDGAVERQGMDKPQQDALGIARDPAADAPLAKQQQKGDAQKSLENRTFPLASPSNGPTAAAAPKPADAMARAAGGKQPNSAQQSNEGGSTEFYDATDKHKYDAGRGKMLLKNQAFGAAPENQAGPRRKALSSELSAFLASDEFSQLARPRDDKKRDDANVPADEQILVVYLTPRVEPASERSFESLLSRNSIDLSDKTLGQTTHDSRERILSLPAEAGKAEAEPLAKAFSGKAQADEAKDRKATDPKAAAPEATSPEPAVARRPLKAEIAGDKAEASKNKSVVPESQLSAADDSATENELYYLEADEGQVQELLRQLRVDPDQFTRLSVATRELPQAGERANLRQEQSLALKTSPAPAGRKRSEAATANDLQRDDQNGMPEQPAQGQLAQTAPPAPLVGALPPAVPAVPAPAAEPQPAAMAAPAPAAPAMAPLPKLPQPATPLANAAPVAAGAARPFTATGDVPAPQGGAFSASSDKPDAGQANEEKANETIAESNATIKQRSLAMPAQLQAAGERVVAYRLRGVDMLRGASSTPAMNRGQASAGATVGAAGGGGFANAVSGKAAMDAAIETKPGKNGAASESSQPGPQNSKNGAPGQPAKSDSPTPALAEPTAESAASSDPAQAKVSADSRLLTRTKETESIAEKAPAEAAKKSAPAAPKRVRVLFVIEHEPAK